jgi:UDP-2,3-diacylglucosamine hydrolase
MFSRRSEFPRHERSLYTAARKADVFVLNGDTFDFRWTTLSGIDVTVVAAIGWLRKLARRFPKCHFHFILGNHDHVTPFIEALDALTRELANLSWHPYYLRLGDTVFLHGDVSDRRMTPAMLEDRRTRREHDTTRHPMFHDLYDVALRINLHRAAHRMRFPRKRVARRVIHYLEEVGHGPVSGIRHVYFGHTHAAMSNFQYRDLVFHNTGSPMHGLEFNILQLELHE